ncbi:MAG: hypothetical protein NTW86_09565 [Candidatus Sumerlaeota bacterium]|nr:hypothetical protein [Candidatus Sumerlaeota bacterium]
MPRTARWLSTGCIAGIAALIVACWGTDRVGPQEAYAKRMREGKNPVTLVGEVDQVRIGAVNLPTALGEGKAEIVLHDVLLKGNIDVLLATGCERNMRDMVKRTAETMGYSLQPGQNGISTLCRYKIAAQEGDMVGYPFDGFYLIAPKDKPFWVLCGDTALVREDSVKAVFQKLEGRARSHSGAPVIAAVGFHAPSQEANDQARETLRAGSLKIVGTGNKPIEFYALGRAAANTTPAPAAAFESPEAYDALGLAMVDVRLTPTPADMEASPSAQAPSAPPLAPGAAPLAASRPTAAPASLPAAAGVQPSAAGNQPAAIRVQPMTVRQ